MPGSPCSCRDAGWCCADWLTSILTITPGNCYEEKWEMKIQTKIANDSCPTDRETSSARRGKIAKVAGRPEARSAPVRDGFVSKLTCPAGVMGRGCCDGGPHLLPRTVRLASNSETLKKKEQGHNEARDTRPQPFLAPRRHPSDPRGKLVAHSLCPRWATGTRSPRPLGARQQRTARLQRQCLPGAKPGQGFL